MTDAPDNHAQPTMDELLTQVADNMCASDIRRLGDSLLRLADAEDQDWRPVAGKSIFRWPNERHRIEREAYMLAEKAQLEYAQRRMRRKFVSPTLLAEPAWDMLLELFVQFAGQARVSVTSLCIASDCPSSTALRHITLLEEEGLVKRVAAAHDKRVTFVELTDEGVIAMGRYLGSI